MATFVMQSLGCEVAALNTVNFSMFLPLLCQGIQFNHLEATPRESSHLGESR
jgi:hypothetical protein